MKTNFSRFGKSAVSVVLSAVMLLSTFLVNAETINNVDSVSDEAVVSDSAAVESSSDDVESADDKSADTTTSNTKKKSAVKALPQASSGDDTKIYFFDMYGKSGDNLIHAWGAKGDYTVWSGATSDNGKNYATTVSEGYGLYSCDLSSTSAYYSGGRRFTGIIFHGKSFKTGNITNTDGWDLSTVIIPYTGANYDTNVYAISKSEYDSSIAETKKVYLDASDVNWENNAYIYYFNNVNGLADSGLEKMNSEGDSVYSYEVPAGYTKVIFLANNEWGSGSQGTMGNQTVDLPLIGHDSKLRFKVSGYDKIANSGKRSGSWVNTYDYPSDEDIADATATNTSYKMYYNSNSDGIYNDNGSIKASDSKIVKQITDVNGDTWYYADFTPAEIGSNLYFVLAGSSSNAINSGSGIKVQTSNSNAISCEKKEISNKYYFGRVSVANKKVQSVRIYVDINGSTFSKYTIVPTVKIIPSNHAEVYAKTGTVRDDGGDFNKYSKMATVKLEYSDGSELNVDTQYDNRVKYAEVERNKEIKVTITLNNEYYLGNRQNKKLKDVYYVKAFCINGLTPHIIDESDADTENGVYTCTYTVKDKDPSVIEITPIYFYIEGDNSDDYITFYAEDFAPNATGDGIGDQWGNTVSAYVWYSNDESKGKANYNAADKPALGGYPGQPMILDGGSYYMQVPRTLNGGTDKVMGVTMNNYYWDDVHRTYGDIGNSKYNCQTYDYDDFVALMNYDKTKDIIGNFKYGTYNKENGGNQPADYTNVTNKKGQIAAGKPTLDLNQFFDSEQKTGSSGNGWKVLVDYYEYPIDLFGNRLKHDDGSYYTEEEILAKALKNEIKVNVVSDGYATDEHDYIGYYATRWYVYQNNGSGTGTFKGAMPPSAFINAVNPTGTEFSESNFLSYLGNDADTWRATANRSIVANSSDSYAKKTVDDTSYYTYAGLANKLFDSYKNQPVVVTFESEIYNAGYNTPKDDPGHRSDVRWYFSLENEKINANVKIQVVDSDGNIVKLNGSDFDAFTSDDSHTGSTTTVNAYFTNPTFNEKTYSGLVDQSDSERFEFKADARSAKMHDDNGYYVYVFRGWYFNSGSSVYTQVNADDLYSVTGSSPMNSSGNFIARYEKVYVNDSLVVSHELYTNLDTKNYIDAPAKQNGTGTPYVSVRVLKADGSPIVTYPDTTGTITVDPQYLVDNDAAKIEVTLSTVTDDDDTSLYDIYRDNNGTTLIASSLQNVNESMSNEKNAGNNNQVIADDNDNSVYGVSGTLNDKKLVYTYDINSFLYNISGTSDRNTLTRNEIRYYSDHSILKTISANIIVKYSDNDGKTYTEDSFGNDNSTTTTKLGVTAQFTNSDEDFANKTSTGEITANANKNFEFAVNNNNTYVTDKDGNAYKFVGWYLQTGSGDNTYDSTKLSNTVTGTKAMDNSATFVAKYVKVETLDISHVLLANETNTDAPQAHNGKATPKVTVEFVKDGAETVTFATEQDTTTTPVQIDKDLLKSYEEQGYSLKVTVIADESSVKLVGAYRYGYGYNNETSTVTETNAYYKSGNQNLKTTEDSSKTTDTLATIGDPDSTTTENRTTIVYTYDISKLFGTGDDSNTLKVPSLKHITDFGTDKVNIIFKYYDRAMNAADSKPTDINTTPSTTTFEEQIGTTENTNVGKIASAITDAAAEVNREKLIENVIDDYKFWTTQADAEKSLKGWTDMRRSEKKEDNTPYTYADLDLGDNYKYHTDRYSRVKDQNGYSLADDDKSGDEQWVTYYSDDDCKNAITVTGDISNSDLYRVKNVVVWGFNYPKTYNVSFKTSLDTFETVDDITIATAAAKDEKGEDINQLLPYYNQRVGTTINNNVIDNDTPHLNAYGFASTTGTEITAPDYEAYPIFDGWYEKINGKYVKVSSDKSYGNRVTKSTTLYAGYRAEGIKTKGITLTQNDVEHYVTTEGTPRVRYVTMLNAYGFDDSDPNFKKLSLVYVKFKDDSINSVTIDYILTADLKNEIVSKLDSNTTGASALTVEISDITTDAATKEISYTYNIVATPTDGSGDSETSVSTGSIRFTNKNRAQFVMDLKETTVSGDDATSPNLLVFAVVKYADSTIYSNDNPNPYKNEINSDNDYVYLASDNYVIYQNGEAVK